MREVRAAKTMLEKGNFMFSKERSLVANCLAIQGVPGDSLLVRKDPGHFEWLDMGGVRIAFFSPEVGRQVPGSMVTPRRDRSLAREELREARSWRALNFIEGSFSFEPQFRGSFSRMALLTDPVLGFCWTAFERNQRSATIQPGFLVKLSGGYGNQQIKLVFSFFPRIWGSYWMALGSTDQQTSAMKKIAFPMCGSPHIGWMNVPTSKSQWEIEGAASNTQAGGRPVCLFVCLLVCLFTCLFACLLACLLA